MLLLRLPIVKQPSKRAKRRCSAAADSTPWSALPSRQAIQLHSGAFSHTSVDVIDMTSNAAFAFAESEGLKLALDPYELRIDVQRLV